ncbi:proteasome-type protease [Synechococcus sp. PCC 7336]|uniref:proteasome-type protease n=1 Tax=Synechococcus sp. PCC 7336 TaxID=195250 RepID=UPI000348FD00|nr:proteasome-type protease [Synechococcus sp. PCC 7336]
MTYCLGIINRFGIVMASDSRTNAGTDYISAYKKIFDLSLPGERVLVICVSGNLSITQGVMTRLKRDIRDRTEINLHTFSNMFDVAAYTGEKIREVQSKDRDWLEKDNIDYSCSFLLGGQIKGEEPQLYLIYSQGNFIQATMETPFLQLGETKYGKPILDRTVTYETSLSDLAKCALLSIDSTMKSNISVGPPINLILYRNDSLELDHTLQLRLGDPYLAKIRKLWEQSLRQAFEAMPDIEWQAEENGLEDEILID